MKSLRVGSLLALLTALAFLLGSSQALAGIIVTEGKISRCVLSLENAQALWNLGVWPDGQEGCGPPDQVADEADPDEDSGHDYDEDDEALDLDEDELGDLDSPPVGYTCSDLGNGLELCEEDEDTEDDEEDGQGASAGSAAGGVWLGATASYDPAPGHDEEGVGGCQAGSRNGDTLALVFAILVGLVVTRRRRAVPLTS